eukprot:UN06648
MNMGSSKSQSKHSSGYSFVPPGSCLQTWLWDYRQII